MMGAVGFSAVMRLRNSVLPSLLVMKIANPREMRWRFAQSAAREHVFVAERLRSINTTSCRPAQIPVLKAVVEQQRIATELFDGVAAALHAIPIHEHDDIP